jgi:uncharacterized protein (TIGR02145 family)
MKKIFWINPVIFITILLFFVTDCKKDEPATVPILSTSTISEITTTTATSGGYLSSDGGAIITSRGVCWSEIDNPTTSDSKTSDGDGIGQYVSNIIGLTAATTYHVRAYATNSVGTAYGADNSFTTLGESPSSITLPATELSLHSATLNGAINPNSLSTTVSFEYGTTTSYGQEVIAIQSPETGSDMVNVSAYLTGLTFGTTYHFRVKAVNTSGTVYGGDMVLTTLVFNIVTDIDGNNYNTITIGNQVWMAENLRSTKYNDGGTIPIVTGTSSWAALSTDAYCWYNNDEATYKSLYGALYNWYAVNTGKLCPSGWHVPVEAEWTTLETYLGSNVAGGKLKEVGTTHWTSPNVGATNETLFTALPGGSRYLDGVFNGFGTGAIFWLASAFNAPGQSYIYIYNNLTIVGHSSDNQRLGMSIRCLKD